jgi:hypothetical protein
LTLADKWVTSSPFAQIKRKRKECAVADIETRTKVVSRYTGLNASLVALSAMLRNTDRIEISFKDNDTALPKPLI